MEDIKEIIFAIRDAMTESLSELAKTGLSDANLAMNNVASLSAEGQKLQDEKAYVLKNFSSHVAQNFNTLVGEKTQADSDRGYGSLSLIEEEDLEAIIAMEGMIAHSRNSDMKEYLAFSTRIDTLLYDTSIDESNNPMDPEQIGEAFREAMRPIGLNSAALLLCYRHFNSKVFHELEPVLTKANVILIDRGVLPELDITARSKTVQKTKRSRRRERADPNDRAFNAEYQGMSEPGQDSPQRLSMMQNLMHGTAAAEGGGGAQHIGPHGGSQGMVVPQNVFPEPGEFPGTGKIPVVGFAYNASGVAGGSFALEPGMMVGNQRVEVVSTDQLSNVLAELQTKLDTIAVAQGGEGATEALSLNQSIGELLQQQSEPDTLNALDNVSSDIINLITLLYDVIWQDETVQIPIKEIIGRTQITALKIALNDPDFFENDDHPGRMLINELATAGISWTDFEKLEQDPMYKKMLEVVESLNTNYEGNNDFVMSLVVGLKTFKRKLELNNRKAEDRLKDSSAREQRLDEVNIFTSEKISERILDKNISPFVKEFLQLKFHKFLVKVVLKEGPGGVSWKPIMNTIDVLLWSVQPDKDVRDKARFEKLRTRLMRNLEKALLSSGMEAADVDFNLKSLMAIQKRCFLNAIRKSKEQLAQQGRAKAALESGTTEEQAEATQSVSAESVAQNGSLGGIDKGESPSGEGKVDEVDLLAGSEPAEAVEGEAVDSVDILAQPEPAEEEAQLLEASEAELEADDEQVDILALLEAASKREDLPDGDEHLLQVNKLPLGVWMEFQADGKQTIRCTLAAKITTIDKYVFVNSDGVKVVEKSRMGLAKELKAGSVKIISESPLIDRAMEAVIGKLRDGEGESVEEEGLSLEPR